MATNWHVSQDGNSKGPFTDAQVRDLASTGRLRPFDLLWREGMAEWVAAEKVRGLFPSTSSPPPPPNGPPSVSPAIGSVGSPLTLSVVGDGKFAFSGDYAQIFQIVEQALLECGAKIKERSMQSGVLRGKCGYGINPFGLTVTASFYDAAPGTRVNVEATLTDSFDTFGACKKKVAQVSERIVELVAGATGTLPSSQGVGSFDFLADGGGLPGGIGASLATGPKAPSYSQRAGVSYRGKAITGLCFSCLGIFVGPTAIIGLVMSSLALNGMATSSNQDGKGMAIAGAIVGLLASVGWILLVLARL
jgi:hypothetical protein